ncbi:MAG: hypothetical protein L0Y72_02165 [Gemmataceae bacterium]|nr:hypothetical protein [Gemmataceae bacterium]MCI0737820.1 hypothetical protein [Gemmataceae bacterium]
MVKSPKTRIGLLIAGLGIYLSSLGCEFAPTNKENLPPPAVAELGAQFDDKNTGTIQGSVTWQGPLPKVPPLKVFGIAGIQTDEFGEQPNPHAPKIDNEDPAVTETVVFLRKVDLSRSRPWNHGPITLELRDRQLRILQDGRSARAGFARRGDSVIIVSRDADCHVLHGRGAAFFALPFADADQPTRYYLKRDGVVELSSGTGFFWMSGLLFVAEHPYYARTGVDGRFSLEKVPAGEYELVCWHANWHMAHVRREQDTGIVNQLHYRPPVEQTRRIVVDAGATCQVQFSWSEGDFERRVDSRAP